MSEVLFCKDDLVGISKSLFSLSTCPIEIWAFSDNFFEFVCFSLHSQSRPKLKDKSFSIISLLFILFIENKLSVLSIVSFDVALAILPGA